MAPVVCVVCGSKFFHPKNMYRHLKKYHNYTILNRDDQIKCPQCQKFLGSMETLVQHVVFVHGTPIEQKEITFSCQADFDSWLKKEEKRNMCKFVVCSYLSNWKKLDCHRSGSYRLTVDVLDRKRQVRQRKSCKIGGTCTAYVTARDVEGQIKVKYCRTHFGHKCDPAHLYITREEKELIATKLLKGVPTKEILHDVRAKDPRHKIRRIHLLNRQDINNIKKEYGVVTSNNSNFQSDISVDDLQLHGEEVVSVEDLHLHGEEVVSVEDLNLHNDDVIDFETWVEAEKKKGTVLFYKCQGKICESLQDADFILVMQTLTQKNMTVRFGADRIVIDPTHRTPEYGFNLTSLFVVDELEQGFPAAFCLSSSVNHETMVKFFCSIKENCGQICCNAFISNGAPVYKDAWCEVMGPPSRTIFFSWHVDGAWLGRLRSIQDEEKRKTVLRELKTTLIELDEVDFKSMFNQFLESLVSDEDTKELGNYLKEHYGSRREEWAYAYRKNCRMNVNMFLEKFHKILKNDYQQEEKNIGVETCLSTLCEFVETKSQDRLIKEYRGICTARTSMVLSRHEEGLALLDRVVFVSNEEWTVASNTEKEIYFVKRSDHKICERKCGIVCHECSICQKAFTCTCKDYRVTSYIICKHIHAVCSLLPMPLLFSEPLCEEEEPVSVCTYSSIIETDRETGELKDKCSEILMRATKIPRLLDNTKTYPHELLDKILEHLKAAETLLEEKSLPSNIYAAEKSVGEPVTSNITRQEQFASIKPNEAEFQGLPRPTMEEINTAKDQPLISKAMSFGYRGLDDHNYCG